MRVLALCLLVAPLALGETGAAYEPASESLVFIPHWIPQAQFAGYYMAVEKGIYQKHGVEVTMLRGGPDNPSIDALASGKAQFALSFLSVALEARDKGVPLINLSQIVQRSALMLVAHKSSGITSPKDFDGKTVSIWSGFEIQPLALFRKFDVHPTVLPQSSTLNLFLRGGVDAASAMWYNEYHLLLNAGLDESELTVITYDDYGLNIPEDGLYCLEDTWQKHPEMCSEFVAASLEGWQYAFDHMDEALAVVMTRVEEAKTGTNRAHQRWMLNRMRDIILPPGREADFGQLRPEDYETAVRELTTAGAITQALPLEKFRVVCSRKAN